MQIGICWGPCILLVKVLHFSWAPLGRGVGKKDQLLMPCSAAPGAPGLWEQGWMVNVPPISGCQSQPGLTAGVGSGKSIYCSLPGDLTSSWSSFPSSMIPRRLQCFGCSSCWKMLQLTDGMFLTHPWLHQVFSLGERQGIPFKNVPKEL